MWQLHITADDLWDLSSRGGHRNERNLLGLHRAGLKLDGWRASCLSV
jgi:hypothetical protein